VVTPETTGRCGGALKKSKSGFPAAVDHDDAASGDCEIARTGQANQERRTRFWKMDDIGERVKKIVVEHLGVEPEKVTDGASFIDDLGADSLDTVELVMAFEEEFGCEIPDDAAETILTVGDAVKFLEKNAKS
jgi:acyl carrier protein